MDRDRLDRVKELLDRALDLPEAERAAFLDDACDDPETRRLVELLLAQDDDETVASGPPGRPTPDDDETGRQVGSYRLGRRLGAGGMGVVHLATHGTTGRPVAVKLVKLGMDSEEILRRFDVERRSLALMDHPNVARVLDAGTDASGRPYFVMEYIAGPPVTTYCDRNRLSLRRRVELFEEICRGVHHAHQKGVIHRDLKPSNILVEEQDGRPVPRIIDFGVARALDRDAFERTHFTRVGQLIGTPEYMSPEQAGATGDDVDIRTDVYSLGVVLYELLVGQLPFDPTELRRAGYDEIRRRIREDTPARPSTRVSGVTEADAARRRGTDPDRLARSCRGDLDWITMKALEKDRDRRYDSAANLAADLRRFLEDRPVEAGPPSLTYRARKFVRRYRGAVAAASLVLAALVAGAAGTTVGMVRARQAEADARRDALLATRVSDFMVDLFRVPDPGESRGATVTAREILDRGVESIRVELEAEPEVRDRLLDVMGRTYRSLGLYDDAESLLRAAAREASERWGDDSPQHARRLAALGGVLLLKRDDAVAREVLERSVAIGERILPPDAPERAAALNNLATALRRAGDDDGALARYREALAVRRTALGDDHPDVARVWNNVGLLATALGEEAGDRERFAEARRAFDEALRIRLAALGEGHPATAGTMSNLAKLLRVTGDLDEARSWCERALAIQERVLGPDHANVARARNNLALVLIELGDPAAARSELETALAIQESTLGADHRQARATAELLAEVQRELDGSDLR